MNNQLADVPARGDLLSLLAKSNGDIIERCWKQLNISPQYTVLKTPEIGMFMVRARQDGDGDPFNVGEVTAARCVIQLDSGEVGFGHCLGRNKNKALMIALIDACFQKEELSQIIAEIIYFRLLEDWNKECHIQQQEISSSKVDFFTMVRGE